VKDELATTMPTPPDGGAAALPSGKVGRFVIVDLLGQGGMAIVLGAYDPDLDRKVALKLLHPGVMSDVTAAALALREARAMAKLSHPNVLTVHEVGELDGRVFIAMELAAGGTLRAWLAERERPLRDVLARFIDAGRGLAAAHEAGLVHRDFKPENVLLTKDGRVRVADFGLVAAERENHPGVAGTPAYMAPEQRSGGVVGPAADQYGFCVALWEALYGARPGKPPVAGREVPAWLRAVLERGLRDDPAERWPSLDELLVALQADPDHARRRRRRTAVALGGAMLALAVTAGATWKLAVSDDDPCTATMDRFAGVWDARVKDDLATRVRALGKPFADRAFAQIASQLDAQRTRWEAMRKDSCVATRVRKEQSELAMDQRAQCLERELGELQSFISALRAPTVKALDEGVQRAAFVADVSTCADVAALGRRSPLPNEPNRRAAIVELEHELAQHRAEIIFERSVGRPLLDATLARARALDYPPLTATALYTAAIDRRLAKDHAEAHKLLQAALLEAEAGGDDMLRFDIEVVQANVVGAWLERFDDGLAHGDRAAAVLRRLRGVDPMLSAELDNALAQIQIRKGDFAAAEKLAERAVATSESARPGSLETALYLNTLTIALNEGLRFEASVQVADKGLAIVIPKLGADHPRVARLLNTRGGSLRRLEKPKEGEADQQRALEIFRASYGDDSFEAGMMYTNLGILRYNRNDFAGAAEYHKKTIAIYERVLGPTHSRTLVAYERLAGTLSKWGKHDEAVAMFQHVIAEQAKSVGKDHPWSSNAHHQLGLHYLKRAKQPEKALVEFDEARRALVASQGPQSHHLSRVYSGLAESYEALDRPRDVVAMYELALACLGHDPTGDRRASYQFYMADALVKIGQRPRALELARAARATLAKIGDAPEDVAEVDAWIAKHAR
jgi:tetratricopeptide (TPR) repeat protein